MTVLSSFNRKYDEHATTVASSQSTKNGQDELSTMASSTSSSKDLTRRSNNRNSLMLSPASITDDDRTRRATMDMTINKLRFHSLGLVGRSEEVAEMNKAIKRAARTSSKELILISGESGTGKTALAKSVELEKTETSMSLSSKFDSMLRDKEPYAGIAGACRELCRKLLLLKERNQERFESICQGIQEAVGPEDLSLLANIISGLDELVDTTPERQHKLAQQSMQERMNRTVYAFRRFFQKLSALFPSTLLIILDDCQWADFASLHLIETLLTDDEIQGLVVIGCYRSDEVFEAHILCQTIRHLRAEVSDSLSVTAIHVGNLNVHQVEELLMELLSEGGSSSIKAFAELCHRKTLGNVFFLQQFLSHLDNASLLKYNFGIMKWTWDEEEIAAQTMATDNVLGLLKAKLVTMSSNINNLLAVLACLGSEVPESVVSLVWDAYCKTEPMENDVEVPLDTLLTSAVKEGFLELHPSLPNYQFVHDKVHECCLESVNPLKLPQLKTQIGQIVLAGLQEGDVPDHFLFVSVGLLNQGLPPAEAMDRVLLARLNLQAAQNAVDSSSFVNAVQYVQRGVNLLPPDTKWSDDLYNLTLDLYSLGAQLEFCTGNFEVARQYCDGVLEQTDRPLADKFCVYNVLQDLLLNENKLADAVKLGFKLCKKLGHGIPKRRLSIQFSILAQVVGAVMRVKKRTVEEVNCLPILTDPTIHQAMHTLDRTTTCCYANKDERLPLTIMANFNITLKHGLSEYSAPTYAAFALILASLGDFGGAAQISDCCMAITERIESPKATARTIQILSTFVFPWFQPLQGLRKGLLKGYYTGLHNGDVETAMHCIANYVMIGFQIGKHLSSVEADIQIYRKQMKEFHHLLLHEYLGILQAVTMELSGQSETDIARDEKTFDLYSQLMLELHVEALHMFRSLLCAIMGYHAEGAQLSIKRGDFLAKKAAPAHHWNISDAFYRAVSLFAMARKTKQKKFFKLAKQQRTLIKGWAKKGCPNVNHYECILDAEMTALSRHDGGKVEELYQKGVAMASRCGFIMDAALGSERCADFLLLKMEDQDGAAYRMREALRYYREWGAQRKVDQIETEHADLLPGRPDDVDVSGCVTSLGW